MADGDSIFGKKWNNDEIVNKLKGEKNTKVNLKVYRRGNPKLLDFEVKRADIPIKSVDAAYMLTNDLGYIKINRFAESTYLEFKLALEDRITSYNVCYTKLLRGPSFWWADPG